MNDFVYSKYQKDIFKEVKEGSGNVMIEAVAGSGKCLKKGEKVIMYDGSLKQVEDVVIGDLLMGDNSTPRKVLSLTNGFGKLYDIIPMKGKKFTVNEDHILSFRNTSNKRLCHKNKVIDESLKNILNGNSIVKQNINNRYDKQWKLFRVGIDFEHKETTFDPYLIGLWLGDGAKNCSKFDNPDREIIDFIKIYCKKNNYMFKNVFNKDKNCNRLYISKNNQFDKYKIQNPFLNYVKTKCIDLNLNKTIPDEFIYNSREVRLKLLAGLIDTDGHYDNRKCFDITLKDYDMIKKLEYLILSLGLYCSYSEKKVKLKIWDKPRTYYRLNISGDLTIIPTLIKRKQASKRFINKDVCKTGWDIKYVGNGEYYGFQLDGNKRFLTEGFIVTHNSSTIVKSLEYIPRKDTVLFLAFNKSVVEELKKKVSSNVLVMTLHSLGYRILRNRHSSCEKPNFKKFDTIYDEIVEKADKYKKFFSKTYNVTSFKFYLKTLVNLVKANNIDFTNEKEIIELMNFYDINVNKFNKDLTFKAIEIVCKKSLDIEKYGVDFSDMIWIPIQREYKDSYDYIFVDEAQDLNKSQMQLIRNVTGPKTRVILVGDKFQSILGFAGSNTSSIDDINKMFQTKQLPLSICYRCPKSHIKEAQKLVPQIEAYDKNDEGIINVITEHDILSHIESNDDMIICRTSAPLIETCLFLVQMGKKAYVKGGDLKEKILYEINSVKKNYNNIIDLKRYFENNVSKMEQDIKDLDEELMNKIDNIGDIQEIEYQKRQYYWKKKNIFFKLDLFLTILAFLKDNNIQSILQLTNRIEEIFSETKDAICCSTIHKSKGLEANNVFLLYPHLLPHPIMKGTTDWQNQQETNVEYVAKTRAKKKLLYVLKVD